MATLVFVAIAAVIWAY